MLSVRLTELGLSAWMAVIFLLGTDLKKDAYGGPVQEPAPSPCSFLCISSHACPPGQSSRSLRRQVGQ